MMDGISHMFTEAGDKGCSRKKLRIVHISDTHMEHDNIVQSIPDGDVIIHSGDFGKRRFMNFFFDDYRDLEMLQKVNAFFKQLPHTYKIFVAGNHDTFLTKFSAEEIQRTLPDLTYLQDSSVIFDDVKFYGSPWTIASSKIKTSKAFTTDSAALQDRWNAIEEDTDVLITHTPPYGMLDYSRLRGDRPAKDVCQFCDKVHPKVGHAGCYNLRKTLLRNIRPKIHLFGHLHGSAGLIEYDGITFSNAAFATKRRFNVIDLYKDITS
ncbi:UPF0046 protein K07C11.7-like [Saccostrea echinata]|uniref:UPF0046 protein K07C11.7-like n=1 Tax=Saccostrea echinata TaxID=191078 RepID=UPI002A82D352|nr:UPF0046 protein K07C11.7-like [Saccostrea echinata]